jgi:hypothetical protein
MEENKVVIETNRCQTPVTERLLASLDAETRADFLSYISGIQYVRNLISPDRKRARDLERDAEGKIINVLNFPFSIPTPLFQTV